MDDGGDIAHALVGVEPSTVETQLPHDQILADTTLETSRSSLGQSPSLICEDCSRPLTGSLMLKYFRGNAPRDQHLFLKTICARPTICVERSDDVVEMRKKQP